MIWTWIYVYTEYQIDYDYLDLQSTYYILLAISQLYCWLSRPVFCISGDFPQFVAWLVHLRSVDLPVGFGLRTPRLWDVFSMLKTDGPRLARESAVSSVGLQNWPYTRFQPRRPTLYSGAGGRKPDSNGHGTSWCVEVGEWKPWRYNVQIDLDDRSQQK